jgi:Tfp pilus assembly protein PilO
MATLTSRTNLFTALGLVGALVLFFFGVRPLLSSIKETRTQVAAAQVQAETLETKLATLQSLKTQFENKKSELSALTVAIPKDPQLAEVVEMISTISARAGLSLVSIQPSQPVGTAVPVNVTVSGGFLGMVSFAELIEKNVRPMGISSLGVVGSSDEGGLSATFALQALYQGIPEEVSQ